MTHQMVAILLAGISLGMSLAVVIYILASSDLFDKRHNETDSGEDDAYERDS